MPAGQFGGPAPGQFLTSLPGGVGLSAKTSTASYSFGFDPSQVTSATLKLWLDARLGVTIATGVSSWADQSGNGNTFTQGTGANQPALSSTAVNGFPGVVGAAGKSLTMAGNVLAQNAARTVYFVATAGVGVAGLCVPRANTGYGVFLAAQSGPSFIESNGVDTNVTIPDAIVINTPHYVRIGFDGVTTHLPTYSLDGVLKITSNGAGTGAGTEGAGSGETLLPGAVGTLGTLLVYSGVVSAGEDAQVLAYLKARYGL